MRRTGPKQSAERSPAQRPTSDILSRVSDPNTLGELIRERRLAAGLSLGQLATNVGRTAATVRAWERDQHFPAADVIDRLAMALDIGADEIEALMQRDPPSLTVVSDEPEDDATPSESTSVSGEASVETDEGEGDDETAEAGDLESAPAAAAEVEGSFAAATADELGILPKIEAPAAEQAETAADGESALDADAVEEEATDSGGDEVGELPIGVTAPAEPEPEDESDVDADVGIEDVPPLVDEPTEAIGPPIAATEPAAAASTSVAVRADLLQEPSVPPILAPLRSIFDPNRKWLYWIRGALTVVAMVALFFVLAWAAGELFDGLGEVLDTIDSTDPLQSEFAPSG